MPRLQVFTGIDPKLTENFLLSQPNVLNASVWMAEGKIHAHVTVHDESEWSAGTLKLACAEELGIHQTPAQIMFISARRRAA